MRGGMFQLLEVEKIYQRRKRTYTWSGYTALVKGGYTGQLIYTLFGVKFPLYFLLCQLVYSK